MVSIFLDFQTDVFDPETRPLLELLIRVNLRAMRGDSIRPKAPKLKLRYQIQCKVIPRTPLLLEEGV